MMLATVGLAGASLGSCSQTPTLYYQVLVGQPSNASGTNCGSVATGVSTISNEGAGFTWVIYPASNGGAFLQGALAGQMLVETSAASGGGYEFFGSDSYDNKGSPDIVITQKVSVSLKPGASNTLTGTLTEEDVCSGGATSCVYQGGSAASAYDCTTSYSVAATQLTGVTSMTAVAASPGILQPENVQQLACQHSGGTCSADADCCAGPCAHMDAGMGTCE